ncbi:ANTAR domain-containing protein [Nocardioides pinisoli]|uniref:ANTAR domain-containing protein n=1 Tax=Nocardioides pinisoli TaxID=2950279 RepID=A0ABT1KS49_9ACTN|nr:ANTAR domain-containing protein [Nocardioides pinisoli]MCP3420568.1 hypothetical protein [Nocardioides pinisoli]
MSRFVDESDSRVVEQAKGALMLRYGIGSCESRAVLDRWAREAEAPVTEVSAALVDGICLGRDDPDTEVMVRWLEQRMRSDLSDVRAAAEAGGATAGPTAGGPAPGEGTATGSVPAPGRSAGARQWRYSSAVHAARVLRSR